MSELIINEFLTLDAVAQAPGGADEDRDGGFSHGGWHMAYMEDDAARAWVLKNIVEATGFVLGRRTYEIFASYWPAAPREEAVIAEPLNTKPKYVASRTLEEPLSWQNSSLLGDDVIAAVRRLKAESQGELHSIGSTDLVGALIEADLVDELRLVIDPVLVGGGKRIFREDGTMRRFRLIRHQVATTGALLLNYRRSE